MITCDTGLARNFVSDNDYSAAYKKAEQALEQLCAGTGAGAEWLGWRDILVNPNDALLQNIDELAHEIRQKADIFIVCGIGGSYLGAKAVIDALSPHFRSNGVEIIYTGHHMGGKYLENLRTYLTEPGKEGRPKSIYVNVISKSGSTLEPALSFRFLRDVLDELYGDESTKRIICTTGETGGVLNTLIQKHGYQKFVIPDNVGGRFSVLTPVGLLPAAVAGIDIRTLFYGAVGAFNRYSENPEALLDYAAIRHALLAGGKTIDIFSCFEPELNAFGGWVQQLLGESEGKEGTGMFPASAAFSTDLHSLGQFIQQGSRSMMETFISVEKPVSAFTVSKTEADEDGLNYLAGKTYHEINAKARAGTVSAHHAGGVPVVNITVEALNAQGIGELIYFFELFAGIYVYTLGVNPFDQPGVEDYKQAMYKLLGK